MDLIALSNQNLVAELITNSVINVKQYGSIGDGINDDINNIQLAINKNPGKTIYFPSGVYNISEPINIVSAKTKLVGAGNESSIIQKTTANAANYQRNYNSNIFDFNEYPSVINLIFPDDSNISNIKIENLVLNGNNRTNYGIVAPHISFSNISNIRINNCIKALIYGGWINQIEKCTFLGNSQIMSVTDVAIATTLAYCHSNQGAYQITNATNFNFDNCSVDNGNPCFDIANSKSVNINNCSTETVNQCLRADNAKVYINGGDFEGHSNANATWKGFFTTQNNANIYVNGTNIHFENYAQLPDPDNKNIVSSNSNGNAILKNVIIKTDYIYKNYISATGGKIELENTLLSKNSNKTGILTKNISSLKDEILRIPFAYGVNYSIFVKAYGQDNSHTSVVCNGCISATASGSNTKISNNIECVSTSNISRYSANISAERDSNTNELVLYFNQTNSLAINLNYEIEYNK